MIVRAIDSNGDWTFGASLNNYLSGQAATAQVIQTNVLSFLGNCFFDLGFGINWYYYIGGKGDQNTQLQLNLAVAAIIVNSPNVTGILQVASTVNPITRGFSVSYKATTTYSILTNSFQYNLI